MEDIIAIYKRHDMIMNVRRRQYQTTAAFERERHRESWWWCVFDTKSRRLGGGMKSCPSKNVSRIEVIISKRWKTGYCAMTK